MASTNGTHHRQEYIARVRYENKLPPPPGAPKLLEIPSDGLDRYLSAGYASKMAREQPLNIETDSLLGMPIDLIGMPGIFDGDDSSILAPAITPPVDSRDAPLLRPLASLGKPSTKAVPVSFLRRTEYISSEASRARSEMRAAAKANTNRPRQKSRHTDNTPDTDPVFFLKEAVKGFDIVHPDEVYRGQDTEDQVRGLPFTRDDIQAWNAPVHPSNPHLKALDAYNMLPDLDAIPSTGGYIAYKFTKAPTSVTDKHDIRPDVGILHPRELDAAVVEAIESQREAHEANPDKIPPPMPPTYQYDFFIPDKERVAKNIRRRLDVNNPSNEDPELYNFVNEDKSACFRLPYLRRYETSMQHGGLEKKFREVALALHNQDDEEPPTQRILDTAAYYYPIIQRLQLRPHRSRKVAHVGVKRARQQNDEDDPGIDYLHLKVMSKEELERLELEDADNREIEALNNLHVEDASSEVVSLVDKSDIDEATEPTTNEHHSSPSIESDRDDASMEN